MFSLALIFSFFYVSVLEEQLNDLGDLFWVLGQNFVSLLYNNAKEKFCT